MNHWKPKAEWRTENFEDHRRFNPRATLKYDLMQIIPNYDPKMDGLFNPHEEDTFKEMKKHEIVKVLRFLNYYVYCILKLYFRIKLDDPETSVIEFRGRQRDIPSKFLRPIPAQAELKYIEYNNLKNVRNTEREKAPKMVDIHVYEINDQIVKKLQVHDDSKTRNRI